jgi:transcriptional regulator with XRE-family HTH domain
MGYSQREAAKLIGVSPSRLSQWERGIKMPSVKNLLKLAILYHTLPDQLYYDLRKSLVKEVEKNISKKVYKNIKEKPP